MTDPTRTRREKDLLGRRDLPADCLYGIQTLRALENFPITHVPISHYKTLIHALAYVKKASAMANREMGLLDEKTAGAIVAACEEIISGLHLEAFVVDVIQGGAGTSTNMNANEVIANRALAHLGQEYGRYDLVHPLNHVNLSQSTNDVYPSALRIALILELNRLCRGMRALKDELDRKGREFSDVLKMGRTQLQDAVPMTLGQEFRAWAVMVGEDIERVREAQSLIREINLGATAVGTGICTLPGYAATVMRILRETTGLKLISAPDLVEATQDTGAYVQVSGVLKRVAVKASKICNDLRLLSSGPRAGLNEINLPPMQPGSSIMPGKVNPVIPEVVNQVAFQVIGSDVTVTLAAEAGQLELNVMEPVIAHNLFQSIRMMDRAFRVLAERCIKGITANREVCRGMVERSIGLVTALVPVLGYEAATEVAQEAQATGRAVYEIVLEKGLLSREEMESWLKPENMVAPQAARPKKEKQ